MITRAYCHDRAVRVWDADGNTHGFNYTRPAIRRAARYSESESESGVRHAVSMTRWSDVHWSDTKPIGPAVLPPGFTLERKTPAV